VLAIYQKSATGKMQLLPWERAFAGNVLYSNTLSICQLQSRVYLTFRKDCSSRVDHHSSWMDSARTTAGPTPFRSKGVLHFDLFLSLLTIFPILAHFFSILFFLFFLLFFFFWNFFYAFKSFLFFLIYFEVLFLFFCLVFSTLVKSSVVWNRNTW